MTKSSGKSKRRQRRDRGSKPRKAYTSQRQKGPHKASPLRLEVKLELWQVALAVIALLLSLAGVALSFLFRYFDAERGMANIWYELGVQPRMVLGEDGKVRDDTWTGWINVTNRGPSTAQQLIVYLRVADPREIPHSHPYIANSPIGADVEIWPRGLHGFDYAVVVSDMAPETGFAIMVDFEATEAEKDEIRRAWETDRFSPEFVSRFVKYIRTIGENTKGRVNGIVSPTPVAVWDYP